MNKYVSICLLLAFFSCSQPQAGDSILIKNVQLLDGSGSPPYAAALRISGEKIQEIGELTAYSGESVIDGQGKILAPGFIDTHSHHDLSSMTDYIAALSQGITTIIIGQDGFSKYPIKDFFQKIETKPGTINVGSYIGHNTLRGKVMGEKYQKKASPKEIDQMKKMLIAEMGEGALGLSTGLEYDPGIYASTDEIIGLA
ncbi:MAG: amidohydrolase family protein, partial [Bacteroidota bacterium]